MFVCMLCEMRYIVWLSHFCPVRKARVLSEVFQSYMMPFGASTCNVPQFLNNSLFCSAKTLQIFAFFFSKWKICIFKHFSLSTAKPSRFYNTLTFLSSLMLSDVCVKLCNVYSNNFFGSLCEPNPSLCNALVYCVAFSVSLLLYTLWK